MADPHVPVLCAQVVAHLSPKAPGMLVDLTVGAGGTFDDASVSFPTVLTDGRVVSCEQDFNGQQPYGALGKDGSFGEIWRSAQAAGVRRVIRDQPGEYSFCRNCPFADRPISSCSFASFAVRPFEV